VTSLWFLAVPATFIALVVAGYVAWLRWWLTS